MSLGPRALALAAWLRHGCGMPAAKISRLFAELGLSVTPGGITLAIQRLADDGEGAYGTLLAALRASPVVSPDETGWRVDAERGWLWVYVGDHVTVYDIAVGRGFDEASAILGEDYAGVLCRDGWAPYRQFASATHQTCLAHLARRCSKLIADSLAGQARIPRTVARLLSDALALRDRRDAGEISGEELDEAIAALEDRVDKILAGRPTHDPNRKLLGHLGARRPVQLLAGRGGPGHQPRGGAGHTPPGVHPQELGRQQELAGRPLRCGARQHLPQRHPARGRPPRGVAEIARTDGDSHGLPFLQGGPSP